MAAFFSGRERPIDASQSRYPSVTVPAGTTERTSPFCAASLGPATFSYFSCYLSLPVFFLIPPLRVKEKARFSRSSSLFSSWIFNLFLISTLVLRDEKMHLYISQRCTCTYICVCLVIPQDQLLRWASRHASEMHASNSVIAQSTDSVYTSNCHRLNSRSLFIFFINVFTIFLFH